MVSVSRKKIREIKKNIIQILDKHLGNDYLLFVFGSYGRTETARSSDIDLAVCREKEIPASIIVQAKDEIERKAGTLRDIDLVNLTDENTPLKLLANILEEGVIWKEAKNSKELLKSLKKRLASLGKL